MAVPVRKAAGLITLGATTLLVSCCWQQVADAEHPRKGSDACAHFGNKTDAGIRCALRELDKSIAQDKRDAAKAREQGAAAAEVSKCVDFLTAGVKSGTIKKDEVLKRVGGKLDDANACPAAEAYGYKRKAQVDGRAPG
jgi:hypothetical protein